MKKNIKLIVGIIIGIAIGAASGIGVYATLTYNAGDIAYTKSGTSTSISVESALNELYQNKKETTNDVKNITANGSITLDKYYKNLNVNVPIPAGYLIPSGTKTITSNGINIDVKQYDNVTVNVPIEFGNTQYNQRYGDLSSNTSTSITLSKGKYIINVIASLGSLTETATNSTSDYDLALSCTNGTFTKLAGKLYTNSASGNHYGLHAYALCGTSTYFAEITKNNSVVSFNRQNGDANSLISDIIVLQAIPISM